MIIERAANGRLAIDRCAGVVLPSPTMHPTVAANQYLSLCGMYRCAKSCGPEDLTEVVAIGAELWAELVYAWDVMTDDAKVAAMDDRPWRCHQ